MHSKEEAGSRGLKRLLRSKFMQFNLDFKIRKVQNKVAEIKTLPQNRSELPDSLLKVNILKIC